jgi:hypothetical protein
MEQGRVAACHAFGMALPPPPETFPYGIYAVPEISTVGQSEEQVKASGVAYECGVARFRETSRGHIMGSIPVSRTDLRAGYAALLGPIVGEGATSHPHRPGGDQSRGHGGFLRQQHLQLSDSGLKPQDRRVGRLNRMARLVFATHLSRKVTSSSDGWVNRHVEV